MTSRAALRIILFAALIVVSVGVYSQGAPPPPPPPPPPPDSGVPLDGGLFLLLGSGLAYAVKRFYGGKQEV